MKNCIVLLLAVFLMFSGAAVAQNSAAADKAVKPERGVYAGLLGPSNLAGISYDSRFGSKNGLGYRVGLSYDFAMERDLMDNSCTVNGVSVPLELNYLLGSVRNRLEFGLGFSAGLYRARSEYWKYEYFQDGEGSVFVPTEKVRSSETRFGYSLFANVGYRYVKRNGFTFRAGVSPSLRLGDRFGIWDKFAFYPYIGFGYSF